MPVQITSGASETIFINFLSRSSRATGPKMRVPRGFNSLSIRTIALLSKRRYEPSLRRITCRVRTTTASTTSPFLTVPSGAASLICALIMSPIWAYRWLRPRTPMAAARLAPVLSATSRMERICNINQSARLPGGHGWGGVWASHSDRGHTGALFDDGHQTPPLGLGERAGLLDADPVSDLGLAGLVMGTELFVAGDDLFELGVRKTALDADDDGLGHPVLDDV